MTTEPIQPGTPSLVQRVKDILLKPGQTWEQIDGEPATIKGLYTGYVAILAAIGPICLLIGQFLFPISVFGVTYRPSPVGAVAGALISYVLALVGVFVIALIIDALAPTFGGTRNRVQAFKVAAYGSTAAWLAGVFSLVPMLAILAILGLYSLYLYYLGLPRLMKVAQEKALPYTAVVVVCAIIFWVLAGAITSSLATAGAIGANAYGDRGAAEGTLTLPGGETVDVGAMERAVQDPGSVEVIPAAELQGLLPAMVATLPRTEINASGASMGGISGSAAEAVYMRDDARISLTVTDMGAMGGLAAMGGMFGVQSSSESEGRYEKIGEVDGRMTTESYDSASRSGEYSVVIGNRVLVAADGAGVSMAQLKSAVEAVNARRIESLLG